MVEVDSWVCVMTQTGWKELDDPERSRSGREEEEEPKRSRSEGGGKKKKNLNALCLEWSEGGSETMLERLPFGEER